MAMSELEHDPRHSLTSSAGNRRGAWRVVDFALSFLPAGVFFGAYTQKEPIKPEDFYLAIPTYTDVKALAALIGNKDFFFAPFNNQIDIDVRSGMSRHQAALKTAAVVIFGDTALQKGDARPTYSFVVRARGSDSFLGSVRFEKGTSAGKTTQEYLDSGVVELSYFFDPKKQKRHLGTQSVLRAVHWLAHELAPDGAAKQMLGNIHTLYATVDPINTASYHILERAGLVVERGGFIPIGRAGYVDSRNKATSRLKLTAKFPDEVVPALEANRTYYSLATKITHDLC